jgi:predicted CopG family antitoxin
MLLLIPGDNLTNHCDRRIAISDATYKELQKLGSFGDTFDSVISRLLKSKDKAELTISATAK